MQLFMTDSAPHCRRTTTIITVLAK